MSGSDLHIQVAKLHSIYIINYIAARMQHYYMMWGSKTEVEMEFQVDLITAFNVLSIHNHDTM